MAVASGFSALLYESLWMRDLELVFGGTREAVTLILAIFMGGMALGSRASASRRLRDVGIRGYALIEFGIGLTAVLTGAGLASFPAWFGDLVFRFPAAPVTIALAKAVLAAALLLPPTLLIGMTTPILVAVLSRNRLGLDRNFSLLYQVNTLGGVLGTLGGTFILLPRLGVEGALGFGVFLNLTVAAGAWALGAGPIQTPKPVPSPWGAPSKLSFHPILAVSMALGAASFLLESVWVRSYQLVVGSSVYSFSLTLGGFLIGIVGGAWIYHRRSVESSHRGPDRFPFLLAGMAGLILVQSWVIGYLPDAYYTFIRWVRPSFGLYQLFGFSLVLLTMLPLTLMFGYFFPALAGRLATNSAEDRILAARLYVWNTLGSVGGALAAGYLLMPILGIQGIYPVCAGLLAGTAGLFPVRESRRAYIRRAGFGLLAAGLAFYGAGSFKPWDPLVMSSGIYHHGLRWDAYGSKETSLRRLLRNNRRLFWYEEGPDAQVAVFQSNLDLSLAINGKVDASTGLDITTQKMLAHLPLLLHPDPEDVFVVGWGSGSTCGSASLYPSVRRVDCAEISKEVYSTRPFFADLQMGVDQDPRFHLLRVDARSQLWSSSQKYDVIISEPSNPWISGVSNLFTEDYYRIAEGRMKPGGLFCQWIQYYSLSPEDLHILLGTFLRVFPSVSVWIPSRPGEPSLGDILILGSQSEPIPDSARISRLTHQPGLAEDLAKCGIQTTRDFLSLRMDGEIGLQNWAGHPPSNRDANPLIEFSAPKSRYRSPDEDRESTLKFFRELTDHHGGSIYPPSKSPWAPTEREQLIRGWLNLGILGRSEEAARELLHEGDRAPELWADWGRIELNRGNLASAEKSLNESLRLKPQNPYAVKFLARTLFHQALNEEKDGRKTAGLKEIRRSLILYPHQPDAAELLNRLARPTPNDRPSPSGSSVR